MTALEYMQKELDKHMTNYGRAVLRNATEAELQGIQNKIVYYREAVAALKEKAAEK